MVTPFSSEHEELLPEVSTRFTLTLKKNLDYENLLREFTELPNTLLLFLTKLKRLQVSVHNGRTLHERRYEYLYHENINQGVIVEYNGKDEDKRLRFFIRKKTIHELPHEEERENITDAEVVLAFPIDDVDRPVIAPQHVCAYLPLKKIGLPFQIQSDFVTQANGEDLVDSAWNKTLRDGVSEVFVEAMVQFGKSDALRYVWPRYLPNETLIDPFWSQLRETITRRLKSVPILRTYQTGVSKCIGQLRFLPKQCCDENGKPLFEDLSDEIYLSDQYMGQEVSALRKIGLEVIHIDEFWDRLKADLRSRSSRMKSLQTSEEWHSSAAKVLLQYANDDSRLLEQVKTFQIIPLRDGSWTSIKSGPVFYHDLGDVEIPMDLGLRILDPQASRHLARKALFDAIGVKHCYPRFVKDLIVGKYAKWNNVDLTSSISHLKFLFHHCTEDELPIHKSIFLIDVDKKPVYRIGVALGRPGMIVDDIYMDIPGAYNVTAVCAKDSNKHVLDIHLIHPAYMALEHEISSVHDLSWKGWLEKHANVLHPPRLVDIRDPAKLSPLFEWIIKRRSGLLLGILKTHWQAYKGLINRLENSEGSSVLKTLQQVKLNCSNGETVPLHDAFVPLKWLLNPATGLGVKEDLRFLQLPTDLPEAAPKYWRFLSIFGTGTEDNLNFYLEALRSISSRKKEQQSRQRHNLIKIYEAIEERAKVDDYPSLREIFQSKRFINAKTGRNDDEYSWVPFDLCVYKGPDFLRLHCVLAKHDDFQNSLGCDRLFTSVLLVPNANCSHILQEITFEFVHMVGKNCSGATEVKARISQLYHALSLEGGKDLSWKRIRKQFENGLIYVPPNRWCSPSECVWSDHTFDPDMFPISHHYSDLETFFVKHLDVVSPTLQSQVRELRILCDSQAVTSEKFANIITLIKEINLWKPQSQDVQELLESSIIPIIDTAGREQLVKPDGTFAIVDNRKYGDMFSKKVATVAIPFEELHSIRNFLIALILDERYMSRLACEASEAENSFEDRALSESFRKRAMALVRCALHFESPRTENGGFDLYSLLRRAKVYYSDEVTKTVSLELNGDVLATQATTGILHVESDESNLRLFVPKDRQERVVSYIAKLPGQLAKQFLITNPEAVKVISDILKADPDCLDEVLSELGIPDAPDLQQIAYVDLNGANVYRDDESTNRALVKSNSRHFSISLTSSTRSISSFAASTFVTPAPTLSSATTPDTRSVSFSAKRRLFSPEARSSEAGEIAIPVYDYITQYRQLLDNVISAGEEGNIPTNFGFASSTLASSTAIAIDPETVFSIRSRDIMAHDTYIDAAGEIYAFEVLLSRLDDFSMENWNSVIRHHVSVHDKYNDLSQWRGKETADIVYEDRSSELTRLLFAYGYLTYQPWGGETPTYYLEVKTTSGPCDTEFFMNKAQVRRMREMRLDPTKPSANIYIILRVYNITSEMIGMRILLDPATMEQDGTLTVEAEQYTVQQPIV